MGRKTRRSVGFWPESAESGASVKAYNPRQLYSQALRADPQQESTDPEWYYRQALANTTSGQLLKSVADCTAALSLDGTFMKALLYRAKCYMDLVKFEEALEDYKKALSMEHFPTQRQWLRDSIAVCREQIRKLKPQLIHEEFADAYAAGKYDSAFKVLTEGLALANIEEKRRAKWFYFRAKVCLKLDCNNTLRSIADCTSALDLDSTFLKALLFRATCYKDIEQFDKAAQDYEAVVKLENKTENQQLLSTAKASLLISEYLQKKIEAADNLCKSRHYDDAYKIYTDALTIDQNHTLTRAKLFYNRAMVSAKVGDTLQSIAGCTSALSLDAAYVEALACRAECYMSLCDFKAAISDCLKALKLHKLRGKKQLLKSTVNVLEKAKNAEEAGNAFSSGKYDLAYYLYSKALAYENDRTKVKLFYNRAKVCLKLDGNTVRSIADCTSALNLDSTFLDALLLRATCYKDIEQFEKAVQDYEAVVKLDHNNGCQRILAQLKCALGAKRIDDMKAKAKSLYTSGCYTEAYKIYTEALNVDPNNKLGNAKLFFNRALIHVKLGNTLKSITDCTTALRLDPIYLKALLLRAKCYVDLERFEEAIRDYQKALQISEERNIEGIRRLLSEAQEKLKDRSAYKILGVPMNASLKQIKAAYRKRARKLHPDKHPNATNLQKKELERKFIEMHAAYEDLLSLHMK